jgi:hypothetical protein
MIKLIRIVFVCALFSPLVTFGQEVKEGSIKVGKDEKKGFIAISKFENDEVQGAIEQKLSTAGIKNGKKKGKFYAYKEVTWPEISPNKVDIFYKVQKKKHKTTIYFVVSKGYDDYITAASDPTASANLNGFLSQIDGIVMHNHEVARKEQEVGAMNARLEQQKLNLKAAEDEKNKKAKELDDLKQKGE